MSAAFVATVMLTLGVGQLLERGKQAQEKLKPPKRRNRGYQMEKYEEYRIPCRSPDNTPQSQTQSPENGALVSQS